MITGQEIKQLTGIIGKTGSLPISHRGCLVWVKVRIINTRKRLFRPVEHLCQPGADPSERFWTSDTFYPDAPEDI